LALTCPSCGGLNRDIAKFCRHCGVPMAPTAMVAPASEDLAPTTDAGPPNRVDQQRRLVLAAVIVLVLGGIGLGVALGHSGGSHLQASNNGAPLVQSTTTLTTEAVTTSEVPTTEVPTTAVPATTVPVPTTVLATRVPLTVPRPPPTTPPPPPPPTTSPPPPPTTSPPPPPTTSPPTTTCTSGDATGSC
jgi:hypothetical protein